MGSKSILSQYRRFHFVTDRKQRQVKIDNARKNARQFMHDFSVGNLFYVEKTYIYSRIDKNHGPYIITEAYTNDTF